MLNLLTRLALLGNIVVALLFYTALYGINNRLSNVTQILAVGIHSAVSVVGGATMILALALVCWFPKVQIPPFILISNDRS